ncbi:Acetyl esterase/lipase [Mucilaginibacter mallensis]|uniref:Acetyl esterase/lipase n=1 Tax=Mucilaginibacter mallensis TaxID=652787 RepID=A0A1H2BLQ5_MUCMA|nr:alpha/beta hydrolase [Mucilaginibacter mallensis]SDT59074.1 Acetyl esterase/lipase [Mucilaginibacter mallensis]
MIRLVFIVIFFLISLLAIFRAPAYYFWLLAIGVTEFPLVFAFITLLLIGSGQWVHKYQLAGTVIGFVSVVLFLSPIVRAYIIATNLKADMEQSLGSVARVNPLQPFDFWNLLNLSKQIESHDAVSMSILKYVTYQDTSLTLDYYPTETPNRPCVIVIHGGSWSSGDSKQLPELNSFLAWNGYNIAAINYRLALKWQTPAPVEDVANAIKYLKQHATELHIDTNQFVLLGRSAGAQIALLAAYTLHDSSIKGVVDFYGPADMVWGYSIPSNPLVMDSRKVMVNYIGGTYEQVPQKYVACSPIEFVDRQSPPTLILHGENDVLVAYEHSRRLNEKLQQNGIKHYWLKLPWATHGFDFTLNGPGGQLSTYAVLQFLNTTTK